MNHGAGKGGDANPLEGDPPQEADDAAVNGDQGLGIRDRIDEEEDAAKASLPIPDPESLIPSASGAEASPGDTTRRKAELLRLITENSDLRRAAAAMKKELDSVKEEKRFLDIEVVGLKERLQKATGTPPPPAASRRKSKRTITRQIVAAAHFSSRLTSLDLGSILSAAVGEIPAILEIPYIAIYLHEASDRRLFLKEHSFEIVLKPIVEDDDAIIKAALAKGGPIAVNGAGKIREDLAVFLSVPHEDEEAKDEKPEESPRELLVAVVVPLTGQHGELVGMLLFADTKRSLPDDVMEPMKHIANSLSSAITNYLLYTEARTLARTDGPTGLLNHHAFFQEFKQEVWRTRRYVSPLSLIIIDLDDLKVINDRLGHAAGDFALVAVADVIRAGVRAVDIPARYGGDEFAIILPSTTVSGAAAVAERIVKLAAESNPDYKGAPLALTVSAGVAEFKPDSTPEELFASADRALYRAKRRGKNRVACITGDAVGTDEKRPD